MPSPDEFWMQKALDFARQGWRLARPNPCVGAVAVRDGVLLAGACSAPDAGPHAEAQLIQRLGDACVGADLYVTLEPCSHYGRNPPCAPAVLKAGFARVIVACDDPNPDVSGRGLALLREAGIEVVTGVLADQAHESLSGFFTWIQRGRPEIWLKSAMTLDGVMAHTDGPMKITGAESMNFVHQLRSKVDGVLVGGATLRLDKPRLNVRLGDPWAPGNPVPIVLSRQPVRELPLQSLLDFHPQICVISPDLSGADARILGIEWSGLGSLADVLGELAKRGFHRILVEAGPALLAHWLEHETWDKYYEARSLRIKQRGRAVVSLERFLPKPYRTAILGSDYWTEYQN